MTQTELSALLTAIDGLGERLDRRIDRVEDKVDEALSGQNTRIARLEASEQRRTGARAVVMTIVIRGAPIVAACVAVATLFIR